ncbi:MAG: nucleoside-diphosphate sugar epimerase/dehydratase [Opitutaceae bacterium]
MTHLSTRKIVRHAFLFVAYSIGLSASLYLAFQLRFDFEVGAEYLVYWKLILICVVGTKLVLLVLFGQFGSLLSYFGLHDLGKILVATAVSAMVSLVVFYRAGVPYAAPRAVILTDFLISFLLLCGIRLSLRLIREGYFQRENSTHRKVAIIGAGDVGAALSREVRLRPGLAMKPIAFFDDDSVKWGTTIHGVAVQGAPETIPEYLKREKVDEIIIAMPNAKGRRVREIVSLLNQHHLRFAIVPSYEQLMSGKVRISQIRPVEIEDLLGRPVINLSADRIRELIQAETVMVTGGGGSIGSELCRQIATYRPKRLLVVERCEFLLFQIEQELLGMGLGAELVPLVADLLDGTRMSTLMERFRPAVVFHAAAHKHVPMMEAQPAEAIRNNVLGTCQLANLALKFGVQRFVLISTDKAINPTNVMGATKRIAELYVQALQRTSTRTKFMAVRFGNVLGSSGSVIPTFKRQIATGGPITVTHPEVTRYFMTVSEAVGLVLQSATLGNGGEIFVLDMGEPMKIVDLAKQLIELSGLTPDADIEIRFVGLRPGEKLYEELNHNTENMLQTEHARIMRFVSEPRTLEVLKLQIDELVVQSGMLDAAEIKSALQGIVPEYQPYLAAI